MKSDNNLRHKMLKLAKEIANKVYIEKVESGVVITIEEQRNSDISVILSDNPKFNSSEFKKMIKDAKQAQFNYEERFIHD